MDRYTYITQTKNACVYVDYKKRKTKIVGNKYIYFHSGIFPYHEPQYYRKLKRKSGVY